MKTIIVIQTLIIVALTVYLFYPKQLKLIATSNSVVVKDGWTTFNFDPPIPASSDCLKVIRFSGEDDVISLKVYTRY